MEIRESFEVRDGEIEIEKEKERERTREKEKEETSETFIAGLLRGMIERKRKEK